jgi:hypothetical protein
MKTQWKKVFKTITANAELIPTNTLDRKNKLFFCQYGLGPYIKISSLEKNF